MAALPERSRESLGSKIAPMPGWSVAANYDFRLPDRQAVLFSKLVQIIFRRRGDIFDSLHMSLRKELARGKATAIAKFHQAERVELVQDRSGRISCSDRAIFGARRSFSLAQY
ncbi:hypothetical protein [Mesorhizobium sp. WSM4887]|uniref:hypothetical protein n=1 Tax=Mesorhizobium sp. WSM4887 TaxID=3038543 RepID=UPI0024169B62|nr:hypothetical protein [Mesorhizobium sp. WSM4887]MDG4889574.1 hypothetical protein [Mesorhizobium sp. WSM4887]